MLNMISPIVGSLFKTVDKVIDNKAEGEKIKAKIQEKLLAGELKELEGAAKKPYVKLIKPINISIIEVNFKFFEIVYIII